MCEAAVYIVQWNMTVKGSNRVICGGAWNNDAENCRSAYRNWDLPYGHHSGGSVGFRLVLPAGH